MLSKFVILNPKKGFLDLFIWALELLILFGFQYVNYNFLGNSTLILLAAICFWIWMSMVLPCFVKKILSLDNKKKVGSFNNAEEAKRFIDRGFD